MDKLAYGYMKGRHMTHKKGLYVGSFDPVTLGHINVIERGSHLFDRLTVLVATNTSKKYLFDLEERLDLLKQSCGHIENLEIGILEGELVADYVRREGVTAVVRGLRTMKDFEYEEAIAAGNRDQFSDFETVFLMADPAYRHLSSSMIKEIAYFKGNIQSMVPPFVESAIKEKLKDSQI